MSDILPREIPTTGGQVTKFDVPFSTFLKHSFQMGQDDSIYRTVSNITEDQLANHPGQSRLLQPAEANEKYGVGSLKWDQPVNESLAQTMSEREKTKMDHEAYLYSGATKARFVPGTVASILGATANPLDFGSMFIPFVGEAGKVRAAGVIGRALEHGLIPAETIAKSGVPLPKLVGSMAQGAMWMGMADLPKIYEAHIENQKTPNIGIDMIGMAAFAGILHGAGAGLKLLSNRTHELISKQNINDFLNDKDPSGHTLIPLDEHVIEHQLRQEAAGKVDLRSINKTVAKELDERPSLAAVRNNQTGEIVTGASHEATGLDGQPHWEQGFVTDKGRFVTRDEAGHLAGTDPGVGYNHSINDTDKKLFSKQFASVDPALLGDDAESDFYTHLVNDVGLFPTEAMEKVLERRQTIRENRFIDSPEGKARRQELTQAAIDKYVADRKNELRNPVKQDVKQLASEKTVSDEHVQKYNGDEAHLDKAITEDIEGLGENVIDASSHIREQLKLEGLTDREITRYLQDPTKLQRIIAEKLHSDPAWGDAHPADLSKLSKNDPAFKKATHTDAIEEAARQAKERIESIINESNMTNAIHTAVDCMLKKLL